MTEEVIWLKVKEVSELLGITESGIKKSISRGTNDFIYEYKTGLGKGGKQIQILLSSLPQEAQDRYYNKKKEHTPILHYTEKQRQEADFKAIIVKDYQVSGLKPNDFIEKFNANDDTNITLTRSKLFNWQRVLKQNNGDVSSLIDNRGGHTRGQIKIDEEVWNYFYSLYMTEQRKTIKRCYDLTVQHFSDKQIQSKKTFERKVKTIPHYAIIRYRHGQKAFKDSLSYMERDYTDINSNDIWFSDHHLADVFVRDSKGKVGRPWITMWSDARSRKTMSLIVRMKDPNTDVVKESLRDGMYDNGVPNELYVDNGKDYKSKDGLSNDYPLSLVNRLGIKTIYATPYHGQAKSIERFFGTLEDRFGKLFDTYAGKDAKNRPESLRDVPLDDYPTLEEYIEKLQHYLNEYHNTPHRGQGMDNKSPNEVYYENLKTKKVIEDKEALTLLCGRTVERVVQRNGITIFNKSYWNEKLIGHYRKKVVVVYDPKNIDELNVFDTSGRIICKAYPKLKTMFRNTTAEDYRLAKKQQQAIKKAVKEYEPKRSFDTWKLIAQNQANDEDFKAKADTDIINIITPELQGNIYALGNSNNKGVENKSVNIINKDDEEIDITGSILNLYKNKHYKSG